MASRRGPQPSEDVTASSSIPEKKPSDSDVSPAVPSHVIFKLLGFTAAMITAPIGMYFVTVDFGGSPTSAGITAAVTANVILFTYIYVAWQEDQEERGPQSSKKEKKAQ